MVVGGRIWGRGVIGGLEPLNCKVYGTNRLIKQTVLETEREEWGKKF